MTGGFVIMRLDEPDGELVVIRVVMIDILLISAEDEARICVQLASFVIEVARAGVGEGRMWTESCGASEFATGIGWEFRG